MASFPTIEQFAREVKDQAIKIIEEETGVSFERLVQLACADQERRCVIIEKPPEEGNEYMLETLQGCWTNDAVTVLKQSAIKSKKDEK